MTKLPKSHPNKRVKTKFSWRLWQFTGADENLFDLAPEQLKMFKHFVRLANAYQPH